LTAQFSKANSPACTCNKTFRNFTEFINKSTATSSDAVSKYYVVLCNHFFDRTQQKRRRTHVVTTHDTEGLSFQRSTSRFEVRETTRSEWRGAKQNLNRLNLLDVKMVN
jgi:hypothetical protein